MKGLWILGGLVAAAVALGFLLVSDSSADLERKYEDAVRDRAAIEQALAECGDLVRYFAERKPTERKKGELEELRQRFEALEKAAKLARDDEARSRDERKQTLERLEDEFFQLKRSAEDLRARLTEMKSFDAQLKPQIRELADLTTKLAAAMSASSDAEFQRRSEELIEQGRKYRRMAEEALKILSGSIVEGRPRGQAALAELKEVVAQMTRLLAEAR